MAAQESLSHQFESVPSPLDYHGFHPDRTQLKDPAAGEGKKHPYFTEPGMVAFADHSPGRVPGERYIHYVSTRPDQTGKGHAAQVLHQVIKEQKPKSVDWGLIDNPEMDRVRQRVQAAHPDLTFRHKQGWR